MEDVRLWAQDEIDGTKNRGCCRELYSAATAISFRDAKAISASLLHDHEFPYLVFSGILVLYAEKIDSRYHRLPVAGD
jgi:hypothetical protein